MKSTKISFLSLVLMTAILIGVSSCDTKKTPPKQTIEYQQANELEEEFKSSRGDTLNRILGFEDTRDFWVSLDTLKKYIEYVEYEAAKSGHTNLGVRIYLGAYPEESDFPNPKYATVFLVPTGQRAIQDGVKGFLPIVQEDQNLEELQVLDYTQGGIPPNDIQ